MNGRWLVSQRPSPDTEFRLFCFPYAGGSAAAAYHRWLSLAPPSVQVCGVEFPGRGIRRDEPAFVSLRPLIRNLADLLEPLLDEPYMLFGHSMGGLVAFEVARALRERKAPQPRHLFISATAAPGTPLRRRSPHAASDAEVLEELQVLGGTPQALLSDRELMQTALGALRADFTAMGTYEYRQAAPLGVPITVFGGRSDRIVPPGDLQGWSSHTTAGCRLKLFPGDHFFLHSTAEEILTTVAGTAGRLRPSPTGSSSRTEHQRQRDGESMNNTTNPVALITGGSRGIGRATALRLAQDGFDIALCYGSDATSAQELEKELVNLGRNTYVRRADVSDAAAVEALVAGAEDALGPITALVTSAAILRDTPLVLMEDEDWQSVLQVNLDGVYHACRAVIDGMMKRRHGAIVNLSSVAGICGNEGQTNYAASKAGIIGFTKSLAQEVGRYGIRANVVAPGYIVTDLVLQLPEEALERAEEQVALRRLGQPEEVADLISFLLSERATYITGGVFQIDGGFR